MYVMPLPTEHSLCFGCSACGTVCPEHAITMNRDPAGFLYPVLAEEKCTGCGACMDVCPRLHGDESGSTEKYYALRGSLEVRKKSTSGGAFQLLAKEVIRDGGIVFGAAFDAGWKLRFCAAETLDGLQPLLGTKYVQAEPGNVLETVREQANRCRKVLFCGDPCLVHGLKLYLEKRLVSEENLLLVDHICFGCPSGGFWEQYVRYLGQLCGSPVERFDFRDKRNHDAGHTVAFTAGGKEYTQPFMQNQYLRIFNRGLSLRESCMSCPYCTPHRNCDLTIGDFWGVEQVRPELDDGYGVSLVIAHNEKGEKALARILPQTEWFLTDAESAMQPRLRKPAKTSLLRKHFINDMEKTGVENCDMELILKKYGGG